MDRGDRSDKHPLVRDLDGCPAVAFAATGHREPINTPFEIVRPQGRVVLGQHARKQGSRWLSNRDPSLVGVLLEWGGCGAIGNGLPPGTLPFP